MRHSNSYRGLAIDWGISVFLSTADRRGSKRKVVDSDHIFKTTQYSSSILLYATGKLELTDGTHTLYLQSGDAADQSDPELLVSVLETTRPAVIVLSLL